MTMGMHVCSHWAGGCLLKRKIGEIFLLENIYDIS
jgi:hypothetical protein